MQAIKEKTIRHVILKRYKKCSRTSNQKQYDNNINICSLFGTVTHLTRFYNLIWWYIYNLAIHPQDYYNKEVLNSHQPAEIHFHKVCSLFLISYCILGAPMCCICFILSVTSDANCSKRNEWKYYLNSNYVRHILHLVCEKSARYHCHKMFLEDLMNTLY